MFKSIIALMFVVGSSSFSVANELDEERGFVNKEIQGTVVLRVDQSSKQMGYVILNDKMKSKSQAQKVAQNAKYKKVPSEKARSELDRDGGSSSWYFYGNYYNNYYYPYFNWYGNYYRPYYTYNWGCCNYYYYGSYWW